METEIKIKGKALKLEGEVLETLNRIPVFEE